MLLLKTPPTTTDLVNKLNAGLLYRCLVTRFFSRFQDNRWSCNRNRLYLFCHNPVPLELITRGRRSTVRLCLHPFPTSNGTSKLAFSYTT